MAHTRIILGSIKFIQLILSVICLILHVYSFMNNLYDSHNTLFCGTFMGFTLVSVALFYGYCIRAPAPKGVDFFFGFMGGLNFYVCGLLALYYPMLDEAMVNLTIIQEASYLPLLLSARLAMICFVTALVYVFEGCLLYDLWSYEANSKRITVKFTSNVEDGKSYVKLQEDLGPLDLTCCGFYLYDSWWKRNGRVQKWLRRKRKNPDVLVVVNIEDAPPDSTPPQTRKSPNLPKEQPVTTQPKLENKSTPGPSMVKRN